MWKLLTQERAVLVLLSIGMIALSVAAIATWGGDLPTPPDLRRSIGQAVDLTPLQRLEALFAMNQFRELIPASNAPNPFFTRYFEPPPPPPPPPPPATRSVEIIYQGFLQIGQGPKRAFVAVDKSVRVVPAGTVIVADLAVADMDRNSLILTNSAGVTNRIEYSAPKKLSVPVAK